MRLSWKNPLCCKIIARVFPVKAIRLKYEIRSARESAYKKVSASLKKSGFLRFLKEWILAQN